MPLAMASYHYGHYGMSKAELRKSNKPIMEKRRRARINTCLNELKSLILDATNKDPARHSKLEKADILEMTVKHLQEIQREQMTSAVSADPSVLTKFHSGFTECATEVSRYVSKLEGVDTGVKRRLMGHLNGCVSGLSQVLPLAANHSASSDEDVNNNNNTAQRILSGLQLVPSRLPSGELAILLPSLDQRQQLHHGGSAFKTVVSQRQMSSTPPPPPPPLSLHPQPPPSPPHHQLHSSPLSPATSSTLAGDDLASEHQVTSTSPEIIVPIPQHPSTTAAAVGFARTTPPPLDLKIEPSNDEPSTSRGDMWRPW